MRGLNRAVALLLALALFVGGLVVFVEIVASLVSDGTAILPWEDWYDDGRRNAWDSSFVKWTSVALLAAGLLLLWLAFKSRRPATVTLPGDSGLPTQVGRRSIERTVDRAVHGVDGIQASQVRAERDALTVKAETARRVPGDLEQRVREATIERLRLLGLPEPSQLKVIVRSTRPPTPEPAGRAQS